MDTKSGVYLADSDCSFTVGTPYQLDLELISRKNELWEKIISRHPDTFDGELLGLGSLNKTNRGVEFECYKTTYSSYISTRDPEFELIYPHLQRANPLGVTVVAISKDEKVLVSKRSNLAEQNPGALYLIGGYASYSEVPEKVSLIEDGIRELNEETGIVSIERAACCLLGIAYDPVYCHPEVTLVVRYGNTYDEICEQLSAAPDSNESECLYGVPVKAIVQDDLPAELRNINRTWSYETSCSFFRQWMKDKSI